MLIDMQCEKIRRLEQEKDKQRKEINRLKRQIKEMEKNGLCRHWLRLHIPMVHRPLWRL